VELSWRLLAPMIVLLRIVLIFLRMHQWTIQN